jgi:DNA-binding CsgD family transcriptional regulator/predicted negative regulator of RcsB-dependent stress response
MMEWSARINRALVWFKYRPIAPTQRHASACATIGWVSAEATSATLESARAAFDQGDFETAKKLYETALAEERTAEALDGLGQSLWMLCDIEEGIALREDAYAEFQRAGNVATAAAIALWLVVEQITSLGNPTAANGWLKRAERLLADAPQCPAHAALEIARGQSSADPKEAESHFERAVQIGQELGDLESEILGRSQLGYLKVSLGDLEPGMSLLDESMAAAMGGELRDPWTIGTTCCSMLFACEQISDLHRAAEWCRVVTKFTQRRSYVPLSALCRSVYAGVLVSAGDWERAETELASSIEAYGGLGRPLAAYPLTRLADLRIRQGRIEEAAQLIAGWEDHPYAAVTAISLLLARGEVSLARTKLDHALGAMDAENPLELRLLPLLVTARLAEDDVNGAADTANELRRRSGRAGHRHLVAMAEFAGAEVAAAQGAADASNRLAAARDLFAGLEMPLEEGRARALLAKVAAEGERELAVAEARAALEIFERLGAARDADETANLLRSLGVRGRSAPRQADELTKRESEVLALLEQGLSNKEIAERLFITPKTAGHHVSRILLKLDLRSRAEAAAYAARMRTEKSGTK